MSKIADLANKKIVYFYKKIFIIFLEFKFNQCPIFYLAHLSFNFYKDEMTTQEIHEIITI